MAAAGRDKRESGRKSAGSLEHSFILRSGKRSDASSHPQSPNVQNGEEDNAALRALYETYEFRSWLEALDGTEGEATLPMSISNTKRY